jgi:hydrogenase/urease accessory protein HupE
LASHIPVTVLTLLCLSVAAAHGVDANTEQFLQNNNGLAIGPFLYIGAKHMVTGYDHLLFLVGVIFFSVLSLKVKQKI